MSPSRRSHTHTQHQADRHRQYPTLLTNKSPNEALSKAKKERDVTSDRQHDGSWKAWVLPIMLCCLVLLAALTPRGIFSFVLLLGQLSIMAVVVYRSSSTSTDFRYRTPVCNVLRAVLGSLLLGSVEVATAHLCWHWFACLDRAEGFASAAVALFVVVALAWLQITLAYATCAISDYMMHRFVWHAHWANTSSSILMRAVRRHYVQHYLGHHRHVHDAETRANMADLSDAPMSNMRKLTIETSSSLTQEDINVLWCSNHGFTVGAERDERVPFSLRWGCRLHTALMFLALPCGTAMLMHAMFGVPLGIWRGCALIGFAVYITFHHDKYHAQAHKRMLWAETRYAMNRGSYAWCAVAAIERWIWLSKEMDQVTEEHMKHHDCAEHREEYYGLVPYGRFFVYPMWQSW